MKAAIFSALLAVFLSACVVVPEHGVIAPPLPPVVVLQDEPYYYNEGYYYYYHDDYWFYSHRRRGPWTALPRERYPRELRYRGERREWHEQWDRGRGHEGGHEHGRD